MNITWLSSVKNPRFFKRDPAYIYRCENLALALNETGQTQLQHLKAFQIQPDSQNTDQPSRSGHVVVFHRPRLSGRLYQTIRRLRRHNVTVVADFDDLVFDPAYAQYSPGVVNGMLSLHKTRRQYRQHQWALRFFNKVTVSTEPLKNHLQGLYPDKTVGVLPNAIHHQWRTALADEPLPSVAERLQAPVITYLSGTRSHDYDFTVFAEDLGRFLQDHPAVKLQITGPLNTALSVRPSQLLHNEKVPFAEYHQHVKAGWVNLAPLGNTPFNRCKSALKVMEAAYWNKPTLCTLHPDNERFTQAGAIAVQGDLYAHLEKLLDAENYTKVTTGLRQRVVPLADINDVAQQFIEFVHQDDD